MHVKVSCAIEFSSDEILKKKNACEYEYEDRIFVFSERKPPPVSTFSGHFELW